jgi:hypothetical protein
MLALRASYPGLANPLVTGSSLSGAFKSLQLSSDSLGVAVIGNFDVISGSGSITFPSAGTWYNYFTGEPLTTTGSAQSFNLGAGEYRVFTSRNLTNSVTTAVGNVNYSANPFGIKVYPNPILNGNSTIEYQLPEFGKTSLTVLNLAGQSLASVDLGIQPDGRHSLSMSQLPLDLSSLSNGYYVIKIVSRQQSSQVPFLLVRR